MSDHADIVREPLKRIVDQQWEEFCPEDGDSAPTDTLEARALAALDALVAERDEAVNARLDSLMRDEATWKERAVAAEARVTELEAALAPMPDAVRDLTHAYHDLTTATGTENIKAALRRGDAARDILFRVEDAARAALAAPTKEGT